MAGVAIATVLLVTGGDERRAGEFGLEPRAQVNAASVGRPAPDFTLAGLDGGTVRLSDFRGRPVVLNFWASWCNPCRKEFPIFRKVLADTDGAFAMVGVDTADIRGDARRFAREMRADWPIGFDADKSVALGYGVDPLPQTFFIDPGGTIVSHVIRGMSESEFRRELRRLGVR